MWFRCLLGTCLSLLAADDWPRFRGPNGSGVSEAKGVPVEFGPATNVRWKIAVPFNRSSPIVAGDRIFLTATEGEKLITMSLDRSSGRTVWRREIDRPRTRPIFKSNDGASATPVTDGTNVYAFFPDLGLVSFGPGGNERWRLPLGPFDTFYGLGASPVLSGNTLIMICDARSKPFLIAVDAATGKVRWRVERNEIRYEGYTTPMVLEPAGEPAQVVVLGAQRVDAYSVATGERLWFVRGLAYFPVGSPVAGKGMLLSTTWGGDAPMGPAFDDVLKKLDKDADGRISPTEGKAMWGEEFGAMDLNSNGFIERDELEMMRNGAVGQYGLVATPLGGRGDLSARIAWRDKKNYSSVPTTLIYQDVVYIVKSGGIIASLDPQTGKVYKVDRSKDAIDEYYSSPVGADNKVILTSESGKVTVLKAGPQWEVLAVNHLGEECYATPAIAGGNLIVRTRTTLYSFGK